MVFVDVRKQGGAAVITIPSAILKLLDLKVGSTLELDVKDRILLAREAPSKIYKRLTLAELLEGVTSETMHDLVDGIAIGKEL